MARRITAEQIGRIEDLAARHSLDRSAMFRTIRQITGIPVALLAQLPWAAADDVIHALDAGHLPTQPTLPRTDGDS